MKIPDRHTIPLEGSDEQMKHFLEVIQKGDPRCRFQLWDRVYKARRIDEHELTPIGTRGTIVGSMFIDEPNAVDNDAYWLIWDGNPVVITSVGRRLEKVGGKATDGFRLEDAYVMNVLHPDTFEIPTKQELEALKPGDYVKLCFAPIPTPPKGEPQAERMWVRIQKIENDRITGFLDNDPVVLRHLKCDDTIDFEHRHIYQIIPTKGIGFKAMKF